MNYLAHAYLSYEDASILTGNMIADYIKGKKALDALPAAVAAGVRLHRAIDAFADAHPATRRAALLFREAYGLYSGPVVDTLMDHFLANDPAHFPNEAALLRFSEKSYALLDANSGAFPAAFAAFYPHMKTHNWLFHYRQVKGMERSLAGLHRRARYMPPPGEAYAIFVGHYYQLNGAYQELMDAMVPHVKSLLTC